MNTMLEILHEEPDLLVISKQAGIATEALPHLPVHRLDKDTSGVLLLAKTEQVKDELQTLFKLRKVKKTYLALVLGKVEPGSGEWLDRVERGRRGAFSAGLEGRVAKLHYRKLTSYRLQVTTRHSIELSLLEVQLVTGRTHQIRVQMKAHGHPIIGDPLYRTKLSRNISRGLKLERQFLHAKEIQFPWKGEMTRVESTLPPDLQAVLNRLH